MNDSNSSFLLFQCIASRMIDSVIRVWFCYRVISFMPILLLVSCPVSNTTTTFAINRAGEHAPTFFL